MLDNATNTKHIHSGILKRAMYTVAVYGVWRFEDTSVWRGFVDLLKDKTVTLEVCFITAHGVLTMCLCVSEIMNVT